MLYKRGDIWHYDFTLDGRRHRGSTRRTQKREAEAKEREAVRRAELGKAPAAAPTIEEVADTWFAARADGRRSEKTTAQRIEIALRLVGRDTPANEIGTPEIAAAMQARRLETTRQGKAPTNATVNRDLIDATLRPILTYAAEVLEIEVRPVAWRKLRLKEPTERVRAFTAEELAKWRAALPEHHRPIHAFIARYALRLREAFFPPEAVDGPTIVVRHRKNGKAHTIRLLPQDARDVASRKGRAEAAGLRTIWFSEPKSGKLVPIHWRAFQSASAAALVTAGIKDARPVHDLRHHAATTVLRRTGDLAAVKKLLGHESIASTMRYAHADDDQVLAALSHTYGTNSSDDLNSGLETTERTGT